ncbi:hypothetical protein LTR53_009171 [Teratosphaeriaceae sp. CCFEE 6253]|nr:hypothetical protein LTR53_009171 [Teratosphaeriaceae sp. CCFEE 6253]
MAAAGSASSVCRQLSVDFGFGTEFTTGLAFNLDWLDDMGGLDGGGVQAFEAFEEPPFATASSEQDTTLINTPLPLTIESHLDNTPSHGQPTAKAHPTASSGSTTGSRATPRPKRSPSPSLPETRHAKRQRNTEAARRYRQRKVDRVSELEEALSLMTEERDELRLKLAKAETEAGVLRGLVGIKGR